AAFCENQRVETLLAHLWTELGLARPGVRYLRTRQGDMRAADPLDGQQRFRERIRAGAQFALSRSVDEIEPHRRHRAALADTARLEAEAGHAQEVPERRLDALAPLRRIVQPLEIGRRAEYLELLAAVDGPVAV